jgi:hypothetical protein
MFIAETWTTVAAPPSEGAAEPLAAGDPDAEAEALAPGAVVALGAAD